MASLIWTSVFGFLVLELVLTLILVAPVPRKIRNFIARKIFKFDLVGRLSKPILFIGLALCAALVDSYVTHRRIVSRLEEEHQTGLSNYPHDRLFHGYDKERKYKAERNMYLTGFALTLLFVIGRITQLMQENVEMEEETERVKNSTEAATELHEDKKND